MRFVAHSLIGTLRYKGCDAPAGPISNDKYRPRP